MVKLKFFPLRILRVSKSGVTSKSPESFL